MNELAARSGNVARFLAERAESDPGRPAVVVARRGGRERVDYAELDRRSSAIARGLARRGVARGARVCLFVRPGIDFIACVYALFKLGAAPVIADPGMGRAALLACIASVRPRVLIGVPRAHAARVLYPSAFASVELAVAAGRGWPGGPPTLERIAREGAGGAFPCAETSRDEEAAVLFTSGSTGRAKGVVYSHANFEAQIVALGDLYGFAEGEIDLACFPLFALFDVAFGMTSVFPDIDPSRPGACDPARVVGALRAEGATTSFASPAVWRRVAPWCRERGLRLDGLRRLLVAGAPVPLDLLEALYAVLPEDARIHTPYGATEALPVSSIEGREALALRERASAGLGTCVGRPAPGVEIGLIRIEDAAIEEWNDELRAPSGATGEVCARGAVVTRAYAEAPEPTAHAKVRAADGGPSWHRMGDLGRLDDGGRLWLQGRKSHRLETERGLRCPVPVENVFDRHPRVARTALVGVGPPGGQRPVLIVEPEPGEAPRGEAETDRFLAELRALGHTDRHAREVETFLFHPSLPVDARHNAKIRREELARWAEARLA